MSEYKILNPVSSKTSYNALDFVDFNISIEGQQIVANSLRLEGKVNYYNIPKNAGNTDVDYTKDFQFDGVIGGHGLVQHLTISSEKFGVLDQNQYYPMTVKAQKLGMKDRMDLSTKSDQLSEMCIHRDELTKWLIVGDSPEVDGGGNFVSSVDFSIKPVCALNNSSGNISYGKTGNLMVNLRINDEFLFGVDRPSFTLSDLRLTYRTLPDSPDLMKAPLVMRGYRTSQNKIENDNVTISVKEPAVCNAVNMFFSPETTYNDQNFNTTSLQYPPMNPNARVEVSFNDSTSKYFSYVIEDEQEMIYQWIKSWNNNITKHGIRYSDLRLKGENFGIGFNFPATDLTNQAFSINLQSNITSAIPYLCFLVFHATFQL